jgi:hypothetical protein
MAVFVWISSADWWKFDVPAGTEYCLAVYGQGDLWHSVHDL